MPDSNSAHTDVIDIINTFKWPVVVLICVIFLAILFKKEIRSFFSKAKKLSLKGVGMEFETGQEQNTSVQEQRVQEKYEPSLLENATKLFRVETINLFRGHVQRETKYDQLITDKEKFDALLNYSITIYIIKHFDLIYDMIFGSQIALLQLLISTGAQDQNIFEHYYNQAKEKYPESFTNFDLDRYPKFLFSYDLLFIDKDQKVQITTLGIDFIKYLIDTRKNIYKDF